MGKCQINKEIIEIGEDVYKSIHDLQDNKWAKTWLNHYNSKEIKVDYLKLLFRSHKMVEIVSNSHPINEITKTDFENLFDEFIEITKRLQNVEADIKVKEFLNSLIKQN